MHYRTVCSVGTCFTATASLVHQLMCTHSPVTVCCVVVGGSPRAEGLTVTPAGRDVVDMVSSLQTVNTKEVMYVSSTSSARCGSAHCHTKHQVHCRTSPHTAQLSPTTHTLSHTCTHTLTHERTCIHTHARTHARTHTHTVTCR